VEVVLRILIPRRSTPNQSLTITSVPPLKKVFILNHDFNKYYSPVLCRRPVGEAGMQGIRFATAEDFLCGRPSYSLLQWLLQPELYTRC
jgi:hypothetical protein